MSGVVVTTDELQEIARIINEIDGLKEDYNVFEPWCSSCDGWHIDAIADGHADLEKRKACACEEPGHIFVGECSNDGDAWHAAGKMLDLVERAKPLLRKLLAEARHG